MCIEMSEFIFGVSKNKLSQRDEKRVSAIARKYDAWLVVTNLTDIEYIRWFAVTNLGDPFNQQTKTMVIHKCFEAGIRV